MIASALGVAYYMKMAYLSATPEGYFTPFFLLFLVLFAASGIGNGSVFRTIAMVFPKEQAGPALGWTLGRSRLRRLHYPAGVRRADQGHHPGKCSVRPGHLLRGVPGAQLALLPEPQGSVEKPLTEKGM
jgi:hypothetical protein